MAFLVQGGALSAASSTVEAGGFVFTHVSMPAGLRLPLHAHARASLNVVIRGEYQESIDDRSRTHPARSVIIKPAGAEHSNRVPPAGCVCVVIEPTEPRLSALQDGSPLFSQVRAVSRHPTADLAFRIAAEMRGADPMAPLLLEGLALELVALAGRGAMAAAPGRRPPAWLRRVRESIHDRGAGVTLPELAAQVGLHPVYVARVFRRHEGCSIGEYARRLRFERALRELRDSNASLAEIALGSGFADQSHFSREFRRRTGLSPRRFRMAQRAEDLDQSVSRGNSGAGRPERAG
jgi:AraC family transcriptional regulator